MSSSDDDESITQKKKVRTERDVGDYKHLSDKLQGYLRQGMLIGSDKKKAFDTYILSIDIDDNIRKAKQKVLNIPEGVVRVFLEIISNSCDNVVESRNQGVDPGNFEVDIDTTTISVKNYGIPIPVKKMGIRTKNGETVMIEWKEGMKESITPPEFIFGQFRSSSNYNDEVARVGIGMNGVGAKACNLFSKKFKVTADDHKNKQRFIGIWRDNFFKDKPDEKPEVEVTDLPAKITKGSVRVEWELDFERFKMNGYSQDEISYFARICADFSFACKVKIIFNGTTLDYRSIYDYASLYFTPEEISNSIVQYTWGLDKPVRGKKNEARNEPATKKLEKTITNPKSIADIPDMEVMILDTPDEGRVISFVNGLVTRDGGNHVDAVQDPIVDYLCRLVNGDKDKTDKKKIINKKDVKPHLSMIVNARVVAPDFGGQTKTKLDSPEIHFDLLPNLIKQINNWEIVNWLQRVMDMKSMKGASATDGKKLKHVKMKGRDANFAGDTESDSCTLFITEGDSATGLPQHMIAYMKGAYDYNGYMPIRGKILNVSKVGQERYNESKIIASIKNVMGFCEGVDYSDDKNLKTLRYGYMMITADADVDGMHIIGLILNLIRSKFPGLLTRYRVGYLRTPVIKMYKGKKVVHRFFTEDDFYRWKNDNKAEFSKLRTKYLKGLGSFSARDAEEDVEACPSVICFNDSAAEENMNLVFGKGKERADQRKEWIEKWRGVVQTDDILSIDISKINTKVGNYVGQDMTQIVNKGVLQYSLASLFRAIPSVYDGLKESQRKGLYGLLTHFNYKYSDKNDPIKVESIANKIAYEVQYHHGAKNLADTIIKMTQDFTGSNNMGYFTKDGMFGSRADGGKYAAAARYSAVQLNWWVPYVFEKESIELIKKRDVDGKDAEPFWLPSVIPMHIVNGANGIGTGHSTNLPCHNPLEIVKGLKEMCSGKRDEFPDIVPWWNGFRGKVTIETRGKGISKDNTRELLPSEKAPLSDEGEESEESDDDEFEKQDSKDQRRQAKLASKAGKVVRTTGIFKATGVTKKGEVIIKITETPVGVWTEKYIEWVDTIIHEKGKKRLITDKRDKSLPNTVDIEIKWKSKEIDPTPLNLHLTRTYSLSNIVFIDHNGFPKKYADVKAVVSVYYYHMIEHYTELRLHRISEAEKRIEYASWKQRFIQAVLDKEIVLVKADEEKMKEQLEKIGVPWKIYDDSKSRDFSIQSLQKWEKEINNCKDRIENAKKSTPQSIWLEKLDALEHVLTKRWDGVKFDME